MFLLRILNMYTKGFKSVRGLAGNRNITCVKIFIADEKTCRVVLHKEFLIRCLPDGELCNLFAKYTESVRREELMHTYVLPLMYYGLEYPYMDIYDSRFHGIIGYEDPRVEGYDLVDRQQRMDLAHASLAIRTLGRLHALSLKMYDLTPGTSAGLAQRTHYGTDNVTKHIFVQTMKMLGLEVQTWPGYSQYGQAILRINFHDRITDMQYVKHRDPFVINHGKYWTNNIFFRYDKYGFPRDVRMANFQTVHCTLPSYDIHYFMITSVRYEVYAHYYDRLIEDYYNMFEYTLNQVGRPSIPMTLEDLIMQLRATEFYALLVAANDMPLAIADENDTLIYERSYIVEGLAGRHIDYLFRTNRFKQAFQKLLPHFRHVLEVDKPMEY